jgi:Na+-transporting NADH:ubiquinone oxidoreductase subunit NqrD
MYPCYTTQTLTMTTSSAPTVFDILLQFIEQAVQFLLQARPYLIQLKNNPLILQLIGTVQSVYSQLPESVSLALTVSLIFISSLMVFKVGRSVIGLIVILIQLAIIFSVAVVVWKLRDPLGAWLEQILI